MCQALDIISVFLKLVIWVPLHNFGKCHLYYFWPNVFLQIGPLFKNFIYFFNTAELLLLIYFIHISVSIPISQFNSPPPPPQPSHFPPLVSIHLFSTSLSLFLPCEPIHLYHFSRFHIYALIYDICFSPSDLLHSVWQSLGLSVSLQMTHFHSFLCLSNIPLYICTTSSLSFCWWAFRLLPWPGYCK